MKNSGHFFENSVSVALFIFVYFAVTSNPMVKPKAIIPIGTWSIEKAQTSLLFGLAAHNYLILRNDKGFVQKELHGTPTEPDGTFIRVAILPGRTLRVMEFDAPLEGDRNYKPSGVTAYKGSEGDTKKKWSEALICADSISDKKLPYPTLGFNLEEDTVNSNSVATTLLSCMNLPSPRVGLLTPGANNLIDKTKN